MDVPDSIWLPILKTAAALMTTGAAIVGVVFPEASSPKSTTANVAVKKGLGRRGKWIVSLAMVGFATFTTIEWLTARVECQAGNLAGERHADVTDDLKNTLKALDDTNENLQVAEGMLGSVVQNLESQSRALFRQVTVGSLTLGVDLCRQSSGQFENDQPKVEFVFEGGKRTLGATLIQLECQVGSTDGSLEIPGAYPGQYVVIPCRRLTQIVTSAVGDGSNLSAHIDVREVLNCAGNDPEEWPVSQYGDLREVKGRLRIFGAGASKACRASLTLNEDIVIEIPLAGNGAEKTGQIDDVFVAAWAASRGVPGENK